MLVTSCESCPKGETGLLHEYINELLLYQRGAILPPSKRRLSFGLCSQGRFFLV